jgi:hypothetical protein
MTDYKALCAELLDEIPHESPLTCMARAALAQSETEKAVNWAAYFARQAAAQEKEPLSPLSLIKSHKLISDATSRARQAAEEIEGRGEPTVMEIIELADEIEAAELGQVDLVRAALARWGNG